MATIPLGTRLAAVVDDADADRLGMHSWNAQRLPSGLIYARRTDGADRTVYMHRAVIGAPPGSLVDHIDSDGLNNRRANLRLVTSVQNVWHTRRDGPVGIYWMPKVGLWRSRIIVSGEEIDIGRFETPEEAAFAYDVLCRAARGQFAVLNGVSVELDRLALSPKARRFLFAVRSPPS